MKNILLIGLASLVLFGVAAGLSVWLQTNSKTTDTAHADDGKKKKPAADEHGDTKQKTADKEPADPHKADDHAKPPAEVKPAATTAKDADRVEYRRLQLEVVAADMSAQMQEYDRLVKKVGVEMLQLLAQQQEQMEAARAEAAKKSEEVGKTNADSKKAKTEAEEAERANIAHIAALADQMPAESTAKTIQHLVDSGKTDTAVKVLVQMKERAAAKVLDAITDPTIPPLLVEGIRTLKRPPATAITP